MLRTLRSAIWRTFGYALARCVVRQRPDERRVLFASHNSMMAGYLAEVWDSVKEDPRVSASVVFLEPESSLGDLSRSAKILPLRRVTLRMANILPWDLVIMANHPGRFRNLAQPSRHSVLRIPHGIGSKLVDGADYQYGRRVFDRHGRIRYTRFFESSILRQQKAEAANPELRGRITVVGSLRLDRLSKFRLETRANSRDRKLVLVAGSWGGRNLFAALDLLGFPSFADRLGNDVILRLRPHPNLFDPRYSNGIDWDLKLSAWSCRNNVQVSRPDSPLEEDLRDADVILSDDLTSVSLFAAALAIPIALFLSRGKSVGVGTLLHKLGQVVPATRSPARLPNLLWKALNERPSPDLDQLKREINAFPGESEERVRHELYNLLGLRRPEGGQVRELAEQLPAL